MCSIVGAILVLIFLSSYYYIIPMMVRKIYQASVHVKERMSTHAKAFMLSYCKVSA